MALGKLFNTNVLPLDSGAKFKVIAIDTNNISYTIRYGLREKHELVKNFSCMQIFVIWTEASWQLII